MKSYNTIDDFIFEMFPAECEKIARQRKTDIERNIENVNANFAESLETIVKGEKQKEAE